MNKLLSILTFCFLTAIMPLDGLAADTWQWENDQVRLRSAAGMDTLLSGPGRS